LILHHASHEATRSQNSVLCHDLCSRIYEPQLCHINADVAADDADTFVAFQIVLVLFLKFSSVVANSSGLSSGAHGFCVYLYCEVKGKGEVHPAAGHEGLEME
jgi:hypothetical protein